LARQGFAYAVAMVRALALLLSLLGLALGAAACGANANSDPEPPERMLVTAQQVEREFAEEAGEELEEAPGADPAWEQLNFGLDPPPELVKRYGIFSIYVVDPANEEAVDSLLSSKDTGEPLAADAEGIYWEKDTLSGTWIATRRYASNVVLTWFSESTEQRVDDRWRRLDAILSGL
jgi:hypothetical protein